MLQSQKELCQLKLTTSNSEEDIWETLAFVVDPAKLKIEVDLSDNAEANTKEIKTSDTTHTDTESSVRENESVISKVPLAPGYGFFPGAPAAPKDVDDSESNLNASQQHTADNSKMKYKLQHLINSPVKPIQQLLLAKHHQYGSVLKK